MIGVAKTSFHGAAHAVAVRRGASERPLYVTASGVDPQEAGRYLSRMAGAHRIPTLPRRVDALARPRRREGARARRSRASGRAAAAEAEDPGAERRGHHRTVARPGIRGRSARPASRPGGRQRWRSRR